MNLCILADAPAPSTSTYTAPPVSEADAFNRLSSTLGATTDTQRLFHISQRILDVVDPRVQRDPGIQSFADWMADFFQRVPTHMYIQARQQVCIAL